MKNLKNQLKRIVRDESAQGATEYILLLVAIVALVMLFKNQLLGEDGQSGVIGGLIGNLRDRIGSFK
ncbi:MAG TPA: hypothetical protein VFV50_16390 [Bdellovibrionales bacterium]|nr:hypothetical protein [Bdellovibrionales bacterium]